MRCRRISAVAAALFAVVTLSPELRAQIAPSGDPAPERVASCDADAQARHIDGDARDSFIRTCLSRKAGDGNLNVEQKKMDACAAKADEQGLEGDARSAAIDACVKPPPPAAKPAPP